MKNPFNARAPTFDADAINATIQRALNAAGLDTSAGPMAEVTQTIRRALAAGRPVQTHDTDDTAVIDVAAREVSANEAHGAAWQPEPSTQQDPALPGSFTAHTFRSRAGSRVYKVYVPAGHSDVPRAMVVMLHGCTQSADDFAAGTQMNHLADTHGFLVVYPEQAAQANMSKCWNWFKPEDQQRGAGEPALIAGIVREVAKKHGADPQRIFVAGLSAGAAMAVVLGETYPELFAGVGAHSGLAYGSAQDMVSAMSAMKGGRSGMPGLKGLGAGLGAGVGAQSSKAAHAVPTIVFHGDRDHTVQMSNGSHIVQQACEAYAGASSDAELSVHTQSGIASGGRRYSRTAYADEQGQTLVESWTVHGGAHAWSGGHASGSYTDASGPNASAEMVRFFLSQSQTEGTESTQSATTS